MLFNNTGFERLAGGFRFYTKGIPVWTDASIDRFREQWIAAGKDLAAMEDDGGVLTVGAVKTFQHLSGEATLATGSSYIGILKMDVDYLGMIFSSGLPEHLRTISRLMTLSGKLHWFFEGFVNELLEEERFAGLLYVIFSGGDDFFLVGAWHRVFEFAFVVQEAFAEFTRSHAFTLSASLLVTDAHYPVTRFARLAEDRLHDAKYLSKDKDSVSIFGQVLTWDECRRARKIKDSLLELIDIHKIPRAVIQKVMNGCDGLDSLRERAVLLQEALLKHDRSTLDWLDSQKPVGEKVWRMNYFLRDVRKPEAKAVVENIIAEYESVVYRAMNGEPVNPMYIKVGARWAELATRAASSFLSK